MSDRRSFFEWVTRPEALIALSAVVIGVCSLFVAIYETHLTRQGHRAAVWPHVEVQPSLTLSEFTLAVVNTGVGPARIEAASVTHFGERKPNWTEALSAVIGEPLAEDGYMSLVNGRVLPPGEREVILSVTAEGPQITALTSALRDQLYDGILDVAVCYCSVFDECWVATMQDVVDRSRGISVPHDSRRVRGCAGAPVSGI